MINWNNWYAKIKNYTIDKIYVESNGEYITYEYKQILHTPLWDKINNIMFWIDKYRYDFEFTKEFDQNTYNEYVHYLKTKKNRSN
jgi:hypothetical protein